jgi:methanogenic corrinoid protein MtbC1
MQFRALTKTELETISSVLDSATQSLQYYDPSKKANVTITTYTGDWEIINKNIINAFGKNEGFSIAFISTKKR